MHNKLFFSDFYDFKDLKNAASQILKEYSDLTTKSNNNSLPYTIYELDEDVIIDIEAPGVAKDDVDVSIDGTKLTVLAKKTKPELKNAITSTQDFGKFKLDFSIKFTLSEDNIKVKMNNGVISITIKQQPKTNRKINIE